MTRYTLTLLEEQRSALRRTLFRDASEYAAILLCGRSRQIDPWTGEIEERFVVKQLIEVSENAFLERTPSKLTWSTTPFYNALKASEAKGLAVAVVHSHPNGPLAFSPADNVAEHELFQIAFDRLESVRPHLSIIMDGDGELIARAYGDDLKAHDVELIRIIGNEWQFRFVRPETQKTIAELDRQIRAFGEASTRDLAQLRIGIAGCGGTGSAVASLLARIGARRIVLFDADRIEETNLNRLHFSSRVDANLRRFKVDIVGEGIANIGLPISVVRVPQFVDSMQSRDALRSCDIIFGCTDDNLGRNLLNRLAHFYLIPVIDMGLLIELSEKGGYNTFDGRVTTVQPGYPCQVCRGLIRPDMMLAEGLRRHDPEIFMQRRRAGYVENEPAPSPVVITFTTELAALAVNELFQRLTKFRGPMGHCAERVRRFNEVKDADSVPGGKSKAECKLCGERLYDGRGDMTPFLDTVV